MKTHLRIFIIVILICVAPLFLYAQAPTAKVDTFCTSWHVCIHGKVGIKSIELLDDPNGILATPARQYKNVYLDPTLDPLNTRKISLTGADSVVCFDVFVSNPLDTAYAPVFITDVSNAHLVVDLYYLKLPPLRVANENLPAISIDSIKYPLVNAKQEICSTIVYINTAQKGGTSVYISDLKLKKNEGIFKLTSIAPSLPTSLSAGDTLKVQICFNPNDTVDFNDSLILSTTCFDAPLPLTGSAGTPLIYATDIDFGDVVVGGKVCKDLTISNKGKLPFILTKNWLLHNDFTFSLDPTSEGYLPFSLLPGKSIKLTFCYSPKTLQPDSTTVDWNTNIAEPFTNQIKSWSYLKGNPVKPGVRWDRKEEFFIPDTSANINSIIQRVVLLNSSTATAHVSNVFIMGSTASEYKIIGNQLNYIPLNNFDIKNGDSIWVDILFQPDLTKPYPERFADRIDSLVAVYDNSADQRNDSVRIVLIGTWIKSDVKPSRQASIFSIHPNPATGRSVIVSFASMHESKAVLQVFDVLGREVYTTALMQGISQIEIAIQSLTKGFYYVRLNSGSEVLTRKFEILR